ncbi:MAG: sulfite exporter TauE/SafE family protein [Bdellovibrionales bacterium]
MDILDPVLLLAAVGFVAGVIDSIAGGGGLITVPALSLILGYGAHAIGTNKLAAVLGTFVSFLIYLKKAHLKWRRTIGFTLVVGIFSFLGSQVTPLIPKNYFPWFLLMTCPIVLFIIFKKDMWVKVVQSERPQPVSVVALFISAAICGFYDGLWGPGGGTFLFLSLILFCHMPLMEALAASKLANCVSALFSFTGYAVGGYVHWEEGWALAFGMMIGSFIGASYNSRHPNSAKVVRVALLIVVGLLLVRVASELGFYKI